MRCSFIAEVFTVALTALLAISTASAQDTVRLEPGMIITESVRVQPATYIIPADSSGAIRIRGDDIKVDFNGAVLDGSRNGHSPDEFVGTGILIESGSNVSVIGAVVRGYRVGLRASDTDSLHISRSNFSYNYRQRLKSTIEREHLDDWMSYHRNEEDQWLRYGAAVYIRDAENVRIDHVTVTGGQNGLMLTEVSGASVYNNRITFNSGVGIALYRSSRNRIQHNRLDFNVRGYSHGVYNRGQDSAAILIYEQSSRNTIAYNSATHSGDGLFLWAGQTTMDTGRGGCNDNLIYENDFSFAPTNGIEVTFSRNQIIGNRIEGCWHGVWGGYSYDSVIAANEFVDNDEHISIEHGQNNSIESNLFEGGELGVYLWERDTQPEDWGYSQNRDVRSRGSSMRSNVFAGVETPIRVIASDSIRIEDNLFSNVRESVEVERSTVSGFRSNVFGASADTIEATMARAHVPSIHAPTPVPGAMSVAQPKGLPRGRQYILLDEWGPVDYRSPVIWPRSPRRQRVQHFDILGPEGSWQVVHTAGIDSISKVEGTVPATIDVVRAESDVVDMELRLEFIGAEVTDRFGDVTPAGEPFEFGYEYFFVPITWRVAWWQWDESTDPRENYDAFRELLSKEPVATETTEDLGYQWYRQPAQGMQGDYFATRAVGRISVPHGMYRLDLTSDDGVRVWVDGEIVHEDWTYHAPRLAQIELNLDGDHEIRIEQFEITGYATLTASLTRIEE